MSVQERMSGFIIYKHFEQRPDAKSDLSLDLQNKNRQQILDIYMDIVSQNNILISTVNFEMVAMITCTTDWVYSSFFQ